MDRDDEFSAYAEVCWGSLVRSAIVLGCDRDEAADLAQTALLRCYTAWAKVRRAEDRDAYVYRILLNCFRDSRRRRWWGERATGVVPDRAVPDPSGPVDVADSVHRALANLSEVHRQVVVLRHYADLSEKQAAEVLGIPAGTVKSRLARALAQLAGDAHLADLFEGENR